MMISSFNPRPSRRTGDTPDMRYTAIAVGVSIRARPEGRAIPAKKAAEAALLEFQSAPVPKDGRYRFIILDQIPAIFCFNPRPSRRTGDTKRDLTTNLSNPLFQSAPVPKDGRYVFWVYRVDPYFLFQSAPVPKDGRYCLCLAISGPGFSFNPRPSRRTGDTKKDFIELVTFLEFQSAPVPKDGRYSDMCYDR